MQIDPEGNAASPDLKVSVDVQKWFVAVDSDHSGKINAKELQAALINAQGNTFSDEACHLMIALFDKNRSGTIGVHKFQYLCTYLNQWMDVFRGYDEDNSGYIEEAELEQALRQMGYRLSNNFYKVLLKNADNAERMSFDQFIVACVKIQRLTNAFRLRDKQMKGVVTFGFEDFVEIVLEDFL